MGGDGLGDLLDLGGLALVVEMDAVGAVVFGMVDGQGEQVVDGQPRRADEFHGDGVALADALGLAVQMQRDVVSRAQLA